jgi:hypothetical protein
LGGLRVSEAGLKARDEFLFGELAAAKIPACVVTGGAYSTPEEAARINFNTIKAAASACPAAPREIFS